MLERGKMDRDLVEFVVIDQLVPKEHLLRKIDAAVDFTQLYEMVEPLYCEDNGRPSIDPVVLFKMVLIQHLYGLPSLRRTAEEVSANNCYCWFLGYPLQEETPHFSTVSYNFRHRFTEETVDRVFAWILDEVAKAGYLSPKAVFIDGTHIKANANTKKQMKEQIPAAARHYAKELMEEVNADREAHGKKPFDEVYDKVTENFPQVEAVVADAAYKTPHICKKVFDDGRVLSTAYKRPHSKNCIKTVQRHIWKDYEELADDARYTPAYAQLYKRRKETIERVFADAKEKHAMRYTQYRGLAQVTNWVKLKFVAMNLKKLATWKWRNLLSSFRFAFFSLIYVRDPVCS